MSNERSEMWSVCNQKLSTLYWRNHSHLKCWDQNFSENYVSSLKKFRQAGCDLRALHFQCANLLRLRGCGLWVLGVKCWDMDVPQFLLIVRKLPVKEENIAWDNQSAVCLGSNYGNFEHTMRLCRLGWRVPQLEFRICIIQSFYYTVKKTYER